MFFRKTNIFIFCCLFFILGIFIISFFEDIFTSFPFLYFCWYNFCFTLLIVFWKTKKIRLACLFSFFLFFGMWRYCFGLPEINEGDIAFMNDKKVRVEGWIVREVKRKNSKQNFELRVEKYFNGGRSREMRGKILVSTMSYPIYKYGDIVLLTCKISAPEEFDGFRYDRYLAKNKIYSLCRYGDIELLENKGNRFYKAALKIKSKIRNVIKKSLYEPEAGLLLAILLGDKSGIRDDLREEFSQVGISHVMAISGMHIGIILGIVTYALLFFGFWRWQAYYISSVLLVVYVIIIGAPPSAVRATFMCCLVMIALYKGRINRMINSLLFAAVVILLINPRLLRDDVGFQLSFLAVLGIIYIFPILKSQIPIELYKKYQKIIDLALVSVSAQFFTLPIIIYNFSIVSSVSIVANLLILWILPVLMTISIFAITLSLLLPSVAQFIFFPVRLIFEYILFVCDFLLKIPGAYHEYNMKIGLIISILYLIILGMGLRNHYKKWLED
jgi:competence protein ComEC